MAFCLHGHVSGAVQGVSFRAFVRAEALGAGVHGWAKNLDDGRVEVLLCGAEAAVRTVAEALRRGPPRARVTEVSLRGIRPPDVTGFTVM